jgi:hypothetical protein
MKRLLIASVLASVSLSLSAHAASSTKNIIYCTFDNQRIDLSNNERVNHKQVPKSIKAWINRVKALPSIARVDFGLNQQGHNTFVEAVGVYVVYPRVGYPIQAVCRWANVSDVNKEAAFLNKKAQEAAKREALERANRLETLRIEKEARELAAKREQEARDLKEAARLEAKIKFEEVAGEGMWSKIENESFNKEYDSKVSNN